MRFDSGLYQWIPDEKRRSRLSIFDVLLIRRHLAEGVSSYKVAESFGIAQCTAIQVKTGMLYGSVPGGLWEFDWHPWDDINALFRDWEQYRDRHLVKHRVHVETDLQRAKRAFNEVKKWLRTSNT